MSTARAPWRQYANTGPGVQETGPAERDAPIEIPRRLPAGAGQQGRYLTRDADEHLAGEYLRRCTESRQITQQVVQRVQQHSRIADEPNVPEPRWSVDDWVGAVCVAAVLALVGAAAADRYAPWMLAWIGVTQ